MGSRQSTKRQLAQLAHQHLPTAGVEGQKVGFFMKIGQIPEFFHGSFGAIHGPIYHKTIPTKYLHRNIFCFEPTLSIFEFVHHFAKFDRFSRWSKPYEMGSCWMVVLHTFCAVARVYIALGAFVSANKRL